MTDLPPATRWLDADQQRSWRALVMGTTLLMDRLDDDLRREFDLSLVEYEILVRLSERDDRQLRMAQLADALAHSRSRVTHTVTRMERAGLVVRSTSPEDGRGILCTMTQKGYDLLVRVAPVHVTGVREHLVDLASARGLRGAGPRHERGRRPPRRRPPGDGDPLGREADWRSRSSSAAAEPAMPRRACRDPVTHEQARLTRRSPP